VQSTIDVVMSGTLMNKIEDAVYILIKEMNSTVTDCPMKQANLRGLEASLMLTLELCLTLKQTL